MRYSCGTLAVLLRYSSGTLAVLLRYSGGTLAVLGSLADLLGELCGGLDHLLAQLLRHPVCHSTDLLESTASTPNGSRVPTASTPSGSRVPRVPRTAPDYLPRVRRVPLTVRALFCGTHFGTATWTVFFTTVGVCSRTRRLGRPYRRTDTVHYIMGAVNTARNDRIGHC